MRKRDLARALAEEVRYRMWVEHRMYVAENALEQVKAHHGEHHANNDKPQWQWHTVVTLYDPVHAYLSTSTARPKGGEAANRSPH